MHEVARFMLGLVPVTIAIAVVIVIIWFGAVWATTVLVLRTARGWHERHPVTRTSQPGESCGCEQRTEPAQPARPQRNA